MKAHSSEDWQQTDNVHKWIQFCSTRQTGVYSGTHCRPPEVSTLYWLQCPTTDLKALSCNVCTRAGGQSRHMAASIPITVHNARDGSMWNGNYHSWAQDPAYPPCVPVFTQCHRCKQSKTEGGSGLGMRLTYLHKHIPVTNQRPQL